MGSAVDRILSAPEVLLMIMEALERSSLPAAARACRAWYSVAVEVIWRECELLALLEVFAPLKFNDETSQWCFDPEVPHDKWERFFAHARLVRTLTYRDEAKRISKRTDGSRSTQASVLSLCVKSYIQLARDIHQGKPLFPCLRKLVWLCNLDFFLAMHMLYIITNAPELVAIQAVFAHFSIQDGTRLLRHLASVSPAKLQTLQLQFPLPGSGDHTIMPPAIVEYLKSLGRKTQLHRLIIFPLRLMIEVAAPVLQSFPYLMYLRVLVPTTTTDGLRDYLRNLAQAVPHLRTLVVYGPAFLGTADGMTVMDVLKHCTQLTELHIDNFTQFGLSFGPKEIRSMGLMWPKLKGLHIPARQPDGTTMPLGWLRHFAAAFPQLVTLSVDFIPKGGRFPSGSLPAQFKQLQRLAVGSHPVDNNVRGSCRIGELLGEVCPPGVKVYTKCPCLLKMPDEDDAWGACEVQWKSATVVMDVVHRAQVSTLRRHYPADVDP